MKMNKQFIILTNTDSNVDFRMNIEHINSFRTLSEKEKEKIPTANAKVYYRENESMYVKQTCDMIDDKLNTLAAYRNMAVA